jgi:hypothetical protein
VRLWLLLLVGCGRIGFEGETAPDARTCTAPVGHDEDGDGIDDSCDGCPHVNDPSQLDQDEDGVGDACDPRVAEPGDSIAFFDAFVVPDPGWIRTGIVGTYTGDSIVADTRNNRKFAFRRAYTQGVDTLVLAGEFGEATPAADRQLTLGIAGTDTSAYYCELQGPPTDAKLALTYTFDGDDYNVVAHSDATAIGNGRFQLSLANRYPGGACSTTWPADTASIAGTLPDGFSILQLGFSVQEVEMQLDYFVIIHSD